MSDSATQYVTELAWAVYEKERESYLSVLHGARRQIATPRVPSHGTVNEYVRHKCRCEECKQANAEYRKSKRTPKGAYREHGTYAEWLKGCECAPCKNHAAKVNEANHRAPWARAREDLRHGTRYHYSLGCRCELCSEAQSTYRRNNRLTRLGRQADT